MKLSTEGKRPHGKAGKLWLRALARKNPGTGWTPSLEEDAAPQVEKTQSHSDASSSATLASSGHSQEQSSVPALSAMEEVGSSGLKKEIQIGPPVDWLERVRKGAPELLVPVEEGGTPRQTALEGTVQTTSLPKDEFSPKISEDPQSQWPLSGRSAARSSTAVSSRPNATSATVRWFERLRLKLMPASAARRSTNLKAGTPPNPSAATSHRLAVPNEPPFRHQQGSPTPVMESAQPVVFKSHDPATPSQNPMQRLQQTPSASLRSVLGSNPFKKAEARTASPEPVSSRETGGRVEENRVHDWDAPTATTSHLEAVSRKIEQGRTTSKWAQQFPPPSNL